MRILVIGSGGREHCLAWKISQSQQVERLYCAPGNAGTTGIAENVSISSEDISGLAAFAKEKQVDLTVVGPEAPLVEGIVDAFEKNYLNCFGPKKEAARLEGSKIFCRRLLEDAKIPQPKFEEFSEPEKALDYLQKKGAPIVVKADGLAAGKGVTVAKTKEEAVAAINAAMKEKVFGAAGEKILLEEMLEGEEASILAFCDGKTILPLVSSQDHKRIFDNDSGPNTGGMGAYSPAPVVSQEMMEKIEKKILKPTLAALKSKGIPYKGILYAGLMISEDKPKLLEYNCRFADPETQAVLPRMKSDIVPVLDACVKENLEEIQLQWLQDAACCVVLASGGYPGKYEKGKEIRGLRELEQMQGVQAFHAGTSLQGEKIVTSGGRVLNIVGLGKTIKDSIHTAYEAVQKVRFEGMHYRKDIGARALKAMEKQ